MSSPVYSEFSFAPASAYAASKNVLPTIRTAVETNFSNHLWNGSEAEILGVEMAAAASFTVKLNRETQLTAKPEGDVFTVRYYHRKQQPFCGSNQPSCEQHHRHYRGTECRKCGSVYRAGRKRQLSGRTGTMHCYCQCLI